MECLFGCTRDEGTERPAHVVADFLGEDPEGGWCGEDGERDGGGVTTASTIMVVTICVVVCVH